MKTKSRTLKETWTLQAYFKNFENADKNKKEEKILSNARGDGYGDPYVVSYYLEGIKSFSEMLEIQLAGGMDYYNDSVAPETPGDSKTNLTAICNPSSIFRL